MSEVNLQGADLRYANLSTVSLFDASLCGANLYAADLSCSFPVRADLRGALLEIADLSRANLTSALLSPADLTRAKLYAADLSGADLRDACLEGADLAYAILDRTTLPEGIVPPRARPTLSVWEASFSESHILLTGIMNSGTPAARNRIRARLRFFRDLAAMERLNLYAFAKKHGYLTQNGRPDTTPLGHYRDDLQERLGGVKLTQPSTRPDAGWKEIELSPAGKALAEWIILHPEYLSE